MVADNPHVPIPPPKGSMQDNVERAMATAERKAWLSLAGYKFWMFGYHAAQWVLLKSVMPVHIRNPFASLVRFAKAEVEKRELNEEETDG